MRHESSTVVVLVGEVGDGLLAELARSPNLSVARPPDSLAGAPGDESAGARPGWEAGALAMREAARKRSAYVIVPDDPLADVATSWRAMWEIAAGPAASVAFEERAAEALAAWQDKRFELPDYYLLIASAQPGGTGPDLYLGPLRAARPHRVVVGLAGPGAVGPAGLVGGAGIVGGGGASAEQAARVLDALRSLEHGPWWQPLDRLIDAARHFYAGGLAETQPGPA